MASPSESIPVLIVGGSLVGLSAAVCLAAHNVPTIVLERHPGSMPHPRALGFTPRTLEIYRALGFQHRIKEADPDFKLLRARVASLAGDWHETFPWTDAHDAVNPLTYSISAGAAIAQDELEEILRSEARQRGVQLRYSSTLQSFEQDDTGVSATVKSPEGQEYTIRASYMIAADGNRSRIRGKLGIEREGERDGKGKMGTISSVMFRAPLDEYLKSGVSQFNIDQPDLKAFMTHYLDGRWALMFRDGRERSTAELKTAISQAIGREDVDFEILTTGLWEMSMLIADKFQSGRVFLAGDAAHSLPPNRGGFGANTGIADAWNLSWKLAAVLSGASRSALLETYEAERRPIALLRKQQILLRADYKVHVQAQAEPGTIIDDVAMEVGELYRSAAVVGTSDDLPPARRPDEWNGQPGTRAAHLWMTRNGSQISSLDLFGQDWTLVSESPEWKRIAETVSDESGIKVKPMHVGVDVQAKDPVEFRKIMGISSNGASLIRPDGIISWRHDNDSTEAAETFKKALRQVSFSTQ